MHRIAMSAVALLSVAGCTGDLQPLALETYTAKGQSCQDMRDILLTVCQVNEKSKALSAAYQSVENDPALFDIPLLTLATTAAGLLLFDAPIDAIKAVGLGAGATTAARGYFNPVEVRAALSDGASGYACLADVGIIVMEDQSKIAGLASTRTALITAVGALNTAIAANPPNAAEKARADKALENATAATKLYDDQAVSAKFANLYMRDKARGISSGLMKRIERKPIDFTAIYKQIAQNAASSVAYATETRKPTTSAATAGERSGNEIAQVEQITMALMSVPDIKTTIGKFDNCEASAVSGSKTT